MQLEIKSTVMRSLLDKAANVMGGCKDITPIVKNFLIETTEADVRVVATDLSLSVIAHTNIVRTGGVARAVMPQMFYDVVKEAPDDVMNVTVTDKEATVKCGTAEWQIKLMNAAEYPDIPTAAAVQSKFDKEKFAAALTKVRPAMSATENRQNLRLVDVRDRKIRACDGARLHQVEVASLGTAAMQIPAAAVDDLMKLLKAADVADVKEVGFGSTDHLLVFQIHNDVFIVNKVVHEFPDVDAALIAPTVDNKQLLQVNRIAVRDAIRRVRITADVETNALVLILEHNKLVLGSQDKFGNTAKQSIDVNWPYDKRELLVNHSHMADFIGVADGADCLVYLGEDKGKRKSMLVIREGDTLGILGQLRMKA